MKNSEPEKTAEAAKGNWEDFSAGKSAAACPVWRRYCDRLHDNLIAEWCGGRAFRRALKTDLFDEAVGGGCLGALAKIATEVHGIDVSRILAGGVSRDRPGFQISCGDVRRLDFPNDRFDLIFSNSTLDHFASKTDITDSIAEFFRALAPSGMLLITLDNPMNPVVWCRNLLPQRPLKATGLVPYFMGETLSMRELVAALDGAGFCVLERRYLMHAPRVFCLHLLRLIEKFPALSGAVLSAMLGAELAAGFPTSAVSGHFSAVLAQKPEGSGGLGAAMETIDG